MQLCEECDRPHDVHGGGGEDEGRAPDTISKRQLLLQIVDGYMYVCLSVPGKLVARRYYRLRQGWGGHIRNKGGG